MLDVRELRADPERARASQRSRRADPALVDALLAADDARRGALTSFEQTRAEQKALGREVAGARGGERLALLARTKDLAARVKVLQAAADAAGAAVDRLQWEIPNVILDGVPAGGEDDYVVLREVGVPRDPETWQEILGDGVAVRDHLEIGERLGAIDIARGVKVAGSRFYFLTGVGAQLELALTNLAMSTAAAAGFIPVVTPSLVKPEIMAGTGFLGAHADEVYQLPADDLYLVGTSEVALAGFHAGEILDLSAGPERYAGYSTCYRREAGSYGKDTRGIIRVHQFTKVEMFCWVPVEQAEDEHQHLLAMQEQMLAAIDVPYRVIDTAAGDLGSSAARKFDCEAWLPSQQRYRELTSTSNCTTFQARRLDVRERHGDATRAVATLNGTLATTRWIVAILENHQQGDGSVVVPEALRPWLGGREILEPVAQNAS